MRIQSIDILRAFAILGVLFRHSSINTFYARAGWAGVDLFFVLSGFLVSGLLFYEYKRTGEVNIKRFLIRRGFKIYPSFYVFLGTAIIVGEIWLNHGYGWKNILAEILFVQSYFTGSFMHTWSLAIEEHFYILLSILILLLVRKKWIDFPKVIIPVFTGAVLLVFVMRFQYVESRFNESSIHFFQTHLRMDGLLIGVIIAYLYHFFENFKRLINSAFFPLLIVSLGLISLPFIFHAGTFFMLTSGLTLMQVGFGILVALVVSNNKIESSIIVKNYMVRTLALIGRYSYSIYLWHLFIYEILIKIGQKEPPVLLYFLSTILGGICLSLIIEQVFLKIRDKYFVPVVVH